MFGNKYEATGGNWQKLIVTTINLVQIFYDYNFIGNYK